MCQDKGALPHSFGIVIHAEAGGVELRDVVGRVVHDPIFLRCVSISTVLNCVNSEWRHCIQMCVLLINCPPPPRDSNPPSSLTFLYKTGCRPFWDAVACWPQAAVGETVQRSCPDFFSFFRNNTGEASRRGKRRFSR